MCGVLVTSPLLPQYQPRLALLERKDGARLVAHPYREEESQRKNLSLFLDVVNKGVPSCGSGRYSICGYALSDTRVG